MNPLALVIEDDEDLSTIFSEAVQAAGFETKIIRDGQSAQEELAVLIPDLIVLDMHLPHVSGADIFTQIHADSRLKNTIVIIATADARIAEMYHDTADFVLVKPIAFTQLRDLTTRLRKK